jgi:hypothetical protein
MNKDIEKLELLEIADLIDARYVHIEEAMGEGKSAERLASRIREIATEYDWVLASDRMPTKDDADRSGRVWWGSWHQAQGGMWNMPQGPYWRKMDKQIPLPQKPYNQ